MQIRPQRFKHIHIRHTKSMQHIDKLYFINLDHRGDRYGEFMDWITGSGFPTEKVERITAFYTPGAGFVGCLASHVKALQSFLASDHKVCMICEDDFMPLDATTFWSHYENLFNDGVQFDLVMPTYNLLESEEGPAPYLKKMMFSYSSSSYLLTREFAHKLLEVWEDALEKLVEEQPKTTQILEQYCTDVVWMPLMKASKWYCFYPRIGKQRDSFSDVQGKFTAYEC
jgi:glycosyl transferase family 25